MGKRKPKEDKKFQKEKDFINSEKMKIYEENKRNEWDFFDNDEFKAD